MLLYATSAKMPIDLLLHSEKISTKHFAIILANMGEFVLCTTIYRKGIDKCALLTYSHGENTMGFCFIEPADKRPVLRALHKGGGIDVPPFIKLAPRKLTP